MKAEVNNLYSINPPSENRSAQQVAKEIVDLYNGDFCLTLSKICRLFRCERKWAEEYILPNVKHIFVTHFFGQYISRTMQTYLSPEGQNDFAHRLYFLSKKSLTAFYRTQAVADQKTQLIDITLYRDPSAPYSKLLAEKSRHASTRPSSAEKGKHLDTMSQLLTETGYALYLDSVSKDKQWRKTALPVIPFDEDDTPFVTTREAVTKWHLHSNTSAYNYMERNGAVRVRFGGKVLWHLPAYTGQWLVPCSYDPTRDKP